MMAALFENNLPSSRMMTEKGNKFQIKQFYPEPR
jgi:hypothetical protein